MSVPTFVASASASATTAAATLACNVPTGTADGDLLIAYVTVAISPAGNTISPPAGWTEVQRPSGARGVVFARIAASEPASYTWGVGASAEFNVIHHAYRPSAGAWSSVFDAIAIVGGQVNASSTTHTFPELPLPASLDMMLVAFVAIGRGSVTTTKPASYTLAENPDSGGTGNTAVESAGAYLSVTAGTAPSDSFTTGNSTSDVTSHIAIIDPGTAQPRLIRAWYTNPGATALASIAIPVPFVGAGDLLVAYISHATGSATFTPPTGWSLLETSVSSAGNDTIRLYEKVADGSEGASLTWTVVSGTSTITGGMLVITDATALGTHAEATDSTSDTSWNVPGLTMAAQSPHAVVLAAVTPDRGDRVISAVPTSHTLLWSIRTGGAGTDTLQAVSFMFETGANPAAGTFTASGTGVNGGIQAATSTASAATGYAWGYVLG